MPSVDRQEGIVAFEAACSREAFGQRREVPCDQLELTGPPVSHG
jgi:hypothetical protein